MTETDEKDAGEGGQATRPRRLELKKTVETGQVRQSFAHGRSKMVTVEVRKKRTFAPDARGRMAEVRREAEREAARGGRKGDALGREGAAVGLTKQEKAARARALEEALRAEEERQAPAPAILEAEPPGMPADVEEIVPPAAAEPVEEIVPPAGEAALPAAEVTETLAPAVEPEPSIEPEVAQPAKPAEEKIAEAAVVPPARPPLKRVDEDEEEAESRKGAGPRRPVRAGLRKPDEVRRDDSGRRSGKLRVLDALDEAGERVRSLASVRRARQKERLKQLQSSRMETQKVVREVVIPETITVQELANRMAERGADVIKALMKMGMMVTINHVLDADTAELVATEFGHTPKRVSEADVELGLRGAEDQDHQLVARPPVVTVMGHVDHGKTSLLDALRHTDVAAHEAGGITQHIGAYQVTLADGSRITFIDTPGHEAFTQMRARGAKVTDVVVLVVAADDGVMPQTIEAIAHARAANVPIIVAINKIDRPDADPQRVKTELMQHGVFVEGMGGDTLCVEVSAKTLAGLDKLAEAVVLQSEVLDLKANPNRPAEGVIIESKMERGRGVVATVLVQRGVLRVGDVFVAGSEWGRVRSLMDATGASVESAGPSTPVEVLGLNGPPAAGDDVVVVDSEVRAREVTEFRQRRLRDARTKATRGTLEQMMTQIKDGRVKELGVVIKADVHGSVEAIEGALQKIGGDKIRVNILHSGVGAINETDVGLARASNALIIGFNVRANPQAREAARRDGVEIRYYSIIYDLIDDIKSVLSGLLAPRIKESIIGYAEVRQVFTISKVGKVAGCMITEGIVRRGARVRLLRDNVVIHEGELAQLKRFKEDVREVKEGYDCGIALASYQDIQIGDMIECFELEEVAQAL